MSITENKYQRGKIYKIISNQTNDIYYGSTIEDRLTNRLSGHRKNYRQWLSENFRYMTSFEIVKFEDAKIILVETFPCKTKYELLAREQFYIDNNDCINKQRALRTESRSVYDKEYYEENKDKIFEYRKQYHQQTFKCECGSLVRNYGKTEHFRTKKHLEYLEKK